MHVLVTWGSKRGGTEEIARMVGEVLEEHGHRMTLASAEAVRSLDGIDAVIVAARSMPIAGRAMCSALFGTT